MGKRDAYLEHLGRVPLFAACTKRELQAVARRSTDVRFGAGHRLVEEGERGYEFFVLVEGTVRVTRRGRKVADLGPGDFFGELALLDHGERTATVTSATPVEAVVLTSQEFDAVLRDVPTLSRRILQGLAGRLRAVDRLAT